MHLHLKYKPTPENASKFASDIIDAAKEISGISLDYSVTSLHDVDNIIESMRQDDCTADQVSETLFGFGCYVGEVFIHQVGSQWRNANDTSIATLTNFPLVIELSNDHFCNPIGKVFKRLDNGEEGSLPYFYRVITSQQNR